MKYECSKCGREVDRDMLVVKRVSFHKMGRGGKILKQRTMGWICRDRCLGEDKEWNLPAFQVQSEKQKKKDPA